MAKQLAGKKVKETKALGNGLVMIIFEDGTFIIVAQMSDIIELDELGVSAGEASDDDDDDEEEDEDDDSEEEEEDDEDSDDEDEEDEDDDSDEDEDEEEDEEEDEITAEDLLAMDFDDMEDLVDDEEMDIDVDDFEDDEEGLRKAIAKKLGLKLPAAKAKKGKKK